MVPSFSSKILGSRMGRTWLLFGVKKSSGFWEEKVRRNFCVFLPQMSFLDVPPTPKPLLFIAQEAQHAWPLSSTCPLAPWGLITLSLAFLLLMNLSCLRAFPFAVLSAQIDSWVFPWLSSSPHSDFCPDIFFPEVSWPSGERPTLSKVTSPLIYALITLSLFTVHST